MGKHLQFDIADLERMLSSQAEMVEQMVLASYEDLHNRQVDHSGTVERLERQINKTEVRIEEQCLEVLALQQPVAIDLRRIASILKINGELERIADLAVNITERTRSIAEYSDMHLPPALEEMLKIALEMLRDSHAAFLRADASLARRVVSRDDEVDRMNRDIISALISQMKHNASQVAGLLHVFSVSRIIERIGDHATNIAEDVIYVAEGEIARHRHARTA